MIESDVTYRVQFIEIQHAVKLLITLSCPLLDVALEQLQNLPQLLEDC